MAVILAEEMEQSRSCIGITVAMATIMMIVSPYNSVAMDYTVGDSQQWDLGPNYASWASGKTFAVGDKLVFTYSSLHSVLEVSKAAYESCSTSDALKSHTGGSTTIALDSSGAKYFICGTGGHCSGGMKLSITVAGASSTTPSSTSPPSSSTGKNSTTPPSASAAVAASYMQIKGGVVLVGSVVAGALAVRIL